MSEFGLTPQGFRVKRLRDIQDSIKSRLLNLKDPDTGETLQVDFDSDDPIIQIINAWCDNQAAQWQLAGENYAQFNPLLATDASLSGLVQLNGIVRKQGSPSSVVLKFFGEPGVLVPAATIVTDSDNKVEWKTTVNVTISQDTLEAFVTAYSTQNGAFNYTAGTINTIVAPINGIQSVVNTSDSVAGVADESDAMLRYRRAKATETPSRGIAESIYGALINLPGVTYAKVFTNRTLQQDDKGIPAKSIACVVRGGDNIDIAKNIFVHAGATDRFFGDTTVNVIDSMQVATSVSFCRPKEIAIDVSIVVDNIEGSDFPLNFESEIQNAIIQYSERGPAGLGISGTAFDSFGFPPSENIVLSRLYIPCNAVKGIKVVSLKIAKHGETLSENDVEIGWDEVGIFTSDNITVTRQE